jgi:2-oxoisovalerate dehydrogenase E2 component (dihydrolipoyl transacylase)
VIADFLLPDLGEGLPEAEIVQWLVDEGDEVALNQTIAEVETAKAVVEIPSPYAGVVRGLHAAAGDVVAVGSPLVSFAVGDTDATSDRPAEPAADTPVTARTDRRVAEELHTTEQAASDSAASPNAATVNAATPNAATVNAATPNAATVNAATPNAATVNAATPNLVGYGATPAGSARPRRRARRTGAAVVDVDAALRAAAPHDLVRPVPAEPVLERPRSTPPVRKLAKDLGVDLAAVAAAHPGDLVTRAHVEEFAQRSATSPSPASTVPPAVSTDARVTRTPIRGVRRHTAAAMVRSAFTAPHATTFLTLDVSATTELIASLRTDRALDGHRIGVLAIVAKAVCLALGRAPALNARWDEEAGEIIEHHFVNLGIAAATDRGLVVPVIRDADALPLVDLADAIADLAATARAGRTAPADMIGGTFSITNVGVFGVDAGTPILNPGEAGILAVGAVRRTPWEHHGEIALRDVLTLSLSFDHRLVDGAEAARFLTDVAGVLREPGRAMLLR